ncbi:MAG: hypothetical protein ACREDS_14465, partial [Limisphaerales bacterium]
MTDEVLNRQQFFNKPICVALAATQTSGKSPPASSVKRGIPKTTQRMPRRAPPGAYLVRFVVGDLG